MVYEVHLAKEAKKDIAKLTPQLKQKLKAIIQDGISSNPYSGKKLFGDLTKDFDLSKT